MTFWGIVRYSVVFSYTGPNDCGSVRVVQHPLHIGVVGNEPGQNFRGPPTALPFLSGGYGHTSDGARWVETSCRPCSKASID